MKRSLLFVAKLILVLVFAPLAIVAALVAGPVYALMALLALAFLLAFEIVDRKIEAADLCCVISDRPGFRRPS